VRVAYAFNVQREVEEATLRAFAFVERPASSRPEQDVVGAVVESALRHHATGAAS
jgi:hypothetical protein